MRLAVIGLCAVLSALSARTAAADVRVSIVNGNVTVSATDATVAQILAEWARVGQTRIVNSERVPSAPISIELANVPEAQALDTLLRSVSGYLAAPRPVPLPNASMYDRIFVLPTSSGAPARMTMPPNGGSPPPAFVPTFTPPPPPDDDQPDDDSPRPALARPAAAPNGQRGPIFNTFPQPTGVPRTLNQPPPATGGADSPVSAGVAPVGVSTPGMVVPTPPQPGRNDQR
jgi:hypothetical protein